jgi:branched-chain amino acid transport system permease protein
VIWQLVLDGLVTGGTYALVAVGYTMVYGVLRLINFAHGDVAMVGAYLALALALPFGPAFPAAALAAAVGAALLGVAIERLAYRPLRRRGALAVAPLVTAIGLSILLENAVQLVFGADLKSFAVPTTSLRLFGAYLTNVQVGMLAAVAAAVVGLSLLVARTPLGRAIRAVADNPELAAVIGLDVDRVVAWVFALGSALAAVAGVFAGLETALQPTMGLDLGLKAFAACVLGGIGNIPGSVVGAFAIGFLENFASLWLPGEWHDVLAFGVLALMLLVRPQGLLGRARPQEVKL